MKKCLLVIWGVVFMAGMPLAAAPSKNAGIERFYGRLVAVDFDHKSFTVSNSRRKLQEEFNWNPETQFVYKKKGVGPGELITDRILAVTYKIENGGKAVQKVVIRPPFGGRKQANPNPVK